MITKKIKKYKKSKTLNKLPSLRKTKKLIKIKKKKVTKHLTIDEYMNQNNPSYPFYKLFAKKSDIYKRFNNLKNYKPNIINKNYRLRMNIKIPNIFFNYHTPNNNIKKKVLLFDNDNFFKYDQISDYFQDEVRLKCIRTSTDKNLNPLIYWNNPKNKETIIKLYKNKYGEEFDYEKLDRILFKLTHSCSSFRPTVVISLLKHFNLKNANILDISAGWGDRLIAAIAANANYYFSTDPNPDLHDNYYEMIKFFKANPNKFIIRDKPLEKLKIEYPPNGEKFDIMISSPPYFDLEVYTDKPGQSIEGRNIKAWVKEFLKPSLIKCWNALKVGGHLVLIINNISVLDKNKHKKELNYIEYGLNFLNNFNNSDFRGCFPYGDYIKGTTQLRNPQPMWIWRKLSNINELKKKYLSKLDNDYKELIKDMYNYLFKNKTESEMVLKLKQEAEHNFNINTDLSELFIVSLLNNKRLTLIISNNIEFKYSKNELLDKSLNDSILTDINIVKKDSTELDNYVESYIRWKKYEKGNNYIGLIEL